MKKIFLILPLLLLPHFLLSQTPFIRIFGGPGTDIGNGVIQAYDGGYWVVGRTNSFGAGGTDIIVLKLNTSGVIEWEKTYGGVNNEGGIYGVFATETQDHGLAVACETKSFNATQNDAYLIKIDSVGNVLWDARYDAGPGTSGGDYFRGIKELSTGELLLTGSINSGVLGLSDALIMKFTASGNLIWKKIIGGIYVDHIYDVIELPNGDYAFFGNTGTWGNGSNNAWVIRTDTSANLGWAKVYAGSGIDNFSEGILTSDGGLLLGGITSSYGSGNFDIYLVKLSIDGTLQWAKTYGGSNLEWLNGLQELPSGGYLLRVYSKSYGPGEDILLISIDTTGNITWSKSYKIIQSGSSGSLVKIKGAIDVTNDGGFIFTGWVIDSSGFGGKDILVFKSDSSAYALCDTVLVTSTTPTVQPINASPSFTNVGAIHDPLTIHTSPTVSDTASCPCFQVSSALISNDTTICQGDSIPLQATGGTTYNWSPASGLSCNTCSNPVASPNVTTTYTVTFDQGQVCESQDSITVFVHVPPSINLGADTTICSYDQLVLDAGTGFSSYLWEDSSTTQTHTVSWSGDTTMMFYVTATDSIGCASADTILVTFDKPPVIDLGPDTLLCAGTQYLLDAGPGFASYVWQDKSSGQTYMASALNDTTILYTVTGKDYIGCISSDSVWITFHKPPVIQLGPDTVICSGAQLLLDAGPGFVSYLWEDQSTGQIHIVSASNDTSLLYYVTGTDSQGCVSSDTIQVGFHVPPAIDLGPDTLLCQADTILLDAGPGFTTYLWEDQSTGQTHLVSSTADTVLLYHVTATDSLGCTSADSISIHFHNTPSIDLGPDTVLCDGGQILLDAGPGFSQYTWQDQSSGQFFTASASGDTTILFYVTATDSLGCTSADSIEVYFHLLTAIHLGNDTLLCAGEQLLLDAGPGFASYVWEDQSTGQTHIASASNDTSLLYYVTGTDTQGCVSSDTIQVGFHVPPAINLGPDTLLCQADTILLDAGPGFTTYLWEDQSTGQTHLVSSTADTVLLYHVTATDSLGCTSADSISIHFHNTPSIDLGPDTVLCDGGQILLDAGPGFSQYTWQDQSSGQFFTTTATGDTSILYFVTAMDSLGCTAADSIEVHFHLLTAIHLGNDTLLCAGEQLLLDAGSGFTSYVWEDQATGQTHIASVTGDTTMVYFVIATDSVGCQSSDTIQVSFHQAPVIDLGPDTTACALGQLVLDAGPGFVSYVWEHQSTGQTHTVSGQNGTTSTYYVTALDSFGCLSTDTITVSYLTAIPINLGPDTIVCGNAQLLLDAGPGFASYIWEDQSTGQTHLAYGQPGTINTYYVTATTQDGCVSTDTIVVEFMDYLSIHLGPDTTICENTHFYLNAGPGFVSYVWNDQTTGQKHLVTGQGGTTTFYSVHAIDPNGCEASDSILIHFLTVNEVDLGPDTTICNNASLVLDAGPGYTAYHWSNGSQAQTITFQDTLGTYTVYVDVIDSNGCASSDTIVITVDRCIGLETPALNPLLDIYPNPAENLLYIRTGRPCRLEVCNALGETVLPPVELAAGTRQMDISMLPAGMYLLRFSGKRFNATHKLIKEK